MQFLLETTRWYEHLQGLHNLHHVIPAMARYSICSRLLQERKICYSMKAHSIQQAWKSNNVNQVHGWYVSEDEHFLQTSLLTAVACAIPRKSPVWTSCTSLREPVRKKYGIFWEFFPYGGGVSPNPKTFVIWPSNFWHAKIILRC